MEAREREGARRMPALSKRQRVERAPTANLPPTGGPARTAHFRRTSRTEH
jgi:hypothetical protein